MEVVRLSRNCLAQASIRIIESTSRKRYIPERKNIKEGGKMFDIERIIQTEIDGKEPMPIEVFVERKNVINELSKI